MTSIDKMRAIRQLISGHLPKPPKKRRFWRQYYNEDGSTIPSNKAK